MFVTVLTPILNGKQLKSFDLRMAHYVLLPMTFVAPSMVEVGLLEVGVETFGTLHRTVSSFQNHCQVEATTRSYGPEPSFGGS